MQKYHVLSGILIVLPSLVWFTFTYTTEIWWIENLTAVPVFILLYYLCLSVVFLFARHLPSTLFSLGLMCVWGVQMLPAHAGDLEQCRQPLRVIQYNLRYENPDLTEFIRYIRSQPVDLVVLQEVSPAHGEQFRVLDREFPFQFGGQRNIGYPSSQMILSKEMLYGMQVHNTPDGHKIIRGVWQPKSGLDIDLFVAHPPSPRSERLWQERNVLIQAISDLTSYSALPITLVVGDFNLSAASERFGQLFPGFSTRPVASWPNWGASIETPASTMIGIDHLWLKVEGGDQRELCSRQALLNFKGSDHSPVLSLFALNRP